MRVLRIINSLAIGGAERSITNNIPIHIKNGLEIDVLLLNGKHTHFIDELKNHGVNIYSLGIDNSIYNPFLIFKLRKYLKNYDIIHGHLFPTLYWIALAKVFFKSKAKFIYTEHATHNRRRSIRIFKYFDRLIYRQYDKIISISAATNNNLLNYLKIKLNTKIIFNGINIKALIDDSKVKFKGQIILREQSKILLQVSGFRNAKDQDTLIKSLVSLPEEYCVFLVGIGVRESICKNLAIKLGVSDRVFFFGLQNNVGQFINKADIIVLSSHWEGFGRAAVEGMALRKPVVASNVPGLSEVVKDAGLLFRAGDDKELAKLVIRLMNNSDYYNLIASKCLERSKKYDLSNMIKGYEEVYDELSN